MCVWVSNPSAQVFVGVIDTDGDGNLSTDLGLDQLLTTATLNNKWRIISALHEPQSGFIIPVVQVVGNLMASEVYVDNIQLYVLQKGTWLSTDFLGAR